MLIALTFHFRSRNDVCGDCLVGNFIPVFRLRSRRWSFGKVLAFCTNERGQQFYLLFGTSGSDTEWVDVHKKPFDAYVMYHRKGEVTTISGFSGPHVVAEPAYDDTPIPFTKRKSVSQRSRFCLQTPVTTSPQLVHENDRSMGDDLSCWTASYCRSYYVRPDSQKQELQESDTQPSPRLWTIDVSYREHMIQDGRFCSNIFKNHCLINKGGPTLTSSDATRPKPYSMAEDSRPRPKSDRKAVP